MLAALKNANYRIGSPELSSLSLESQLRLDPDAVIVELKTLSFTGIITAVNDSTNTSVSQLSPAKLDRAIQMMTWLRETGRAAQLRGYQYVTTVQNIKWADDNSGQWYSPAYVGDGLRS